MIPPPVVMAYGLLIAIPTLKLAAAVACRPAWRRLKALRDELERDPAYEESDRVHIRNEFNKGFGSPVMLAIPVIVPLAMPIVALMVRAHDLDAATTKRRAAVFESKMNRLQAARDPNYRPMSDDLRNDRRLQALQDLALPLGFARYPVATLLVVVGLVTTGWLPLIVLGWHAMCRLLINGARTLLQPSQASRRLFTLAMWSS